MKKCDPRAYAACAYKSDCGPLGEAEYADGSECEQFNEKMVNRPSTNADRIRTMSDEELAQFIPNWSYTNACKCGEHYVGCNNECEKCVAEWLRKPAEEGSGNDVERRVFP